MESLTDRHHAREEYKKNPFAQAIEETLSDIKRHDDPFFKEILTRFGDSLLKDDPQWSLHCAEGIANHIRTLEKDQKSKSKMLGLVNRLQPFMSGLSMYTKAFESAIEAGPAPAAFLYGGAQLVLQLSHNLSSCFETVIGIMERIGTLLECYDKFSNAYRSSKKMQSLLVNSYRTIVSFWRKAFKLLNRKVYKTVFTGFFKPLDAEWKKCQDNLRSDCEDVRTLAQATEGALSSDYRQQELQKQIGDWIKAGEDEGGLDVRPSLRINSELQQEGTCSWLYDEEAFKSWYEAQTSAVAWYHAPPGAGKTVLAATLVKHLQEQNLKTVYFFCSFSDPTRRKPINVLRSIALQILAHLDDIPDRVLSQYKTEIKNHISNLRDIVPAVNLVEALLMSCPRIHIVIDGLDECYDRDREMLLVTLFELLNCKLYGVVKWFFTSRNERSIIQMMRMAGAMEICPSKESIESDIRLYLEDQMIAMDKCKHQVDYWTSAAEGNFLWSKLILQIMKGDDFICDDDAKEALEKFPKGLTGCYSRSLEQLSQFSDDEQELARRIFMMLVMARQPLRLSELVNALAVRKGALDHSDGRVPKARLKNGSSSVDKRKSIEELCDKFVIFDDDSTESGSDPLLKFFHKSVYEFFTQDPDTLDVSSALKKYFVREKEANREMGEMCVTYLSYARYSQPLDFEEVLGEEAATKHSFLKYAATFWFWHLHLGDHSQELYDRVCEFVQSPNFWNCVAVQSRIGPYLFSVFTCEGDSCYSMGVSEQAESNQESKNYADPLPHWLDEYGPLGKLIVKGFQSFIKEWSPVLTAHPDAIDQCMMQRNSMESFLARDNLEAKRVQRFTSQDLFRLSGLEQTTSVERSRSNDIIRKKVKDAVEQLGYQNLEVANTMRSQDATRYSGGEPDSSVALLPWNIEGENGTHNWTLDLQRLSLKHKHNQANSDFEAPKQISQLAVSSSQTNEKRWTVISTQVHKHPVVGEVISHHCLLALREKKIFNDRNSDSGYGSGDSDDSSDEDSDSDSNSETDESGSEPEEEDEEMPEDSVPHCLILLPKEAKPIWSFSSLSTGKRRDYTPCFHPSQPIAVWSQSAHELKIANLNTGSVATEVLPEPADAQLSSAAVVCKEFKFSANGKQLHYLVCSLAKTEQVIICTLSLSSFDFPEDAAERKSLHRSSQSQKVTYRFAGCINKSMSVKTILTYWGSKHIYVALPPLNCKPKIVRLSLPKEESIMDLSKEPMFQTLKTPVFFPFPTSQRNTKIAFRDLTTPTPDGGRSKKRDLLVLVLDADRSSVSFPENSSSPQSQVESQDIFTWTISKKDGWRDWDASIDECTTELEEDEEQYRKLRGTFVTEEQRFNVLIRSGLDWTKKAFLSCA